MLKSYATRRLLFTLPLLFLLSCTGQRAPAEEELTTFILVRHAEKDFGRDPDLIASGKERAERLREMLTKVELDAVYSTNTKRTRQTAGPTAEYHELTVDIYSAEQLEIFARTVKRRSPGETVLIVGHSNTTPAMANYLTGTEDYPRFLETDYNNLYVVTLGKNTKPRVLKMRF